LKYFQAIRRWRAIWLNAEDLAMSGSGVEVPTRQKRRFGLWTWVAIALAAVVLFYTVVLALNWPFTKQALISTLQERSLRQVTIDRFHKTYFPPGCIAEGIRFLHIKHKERPPLLTIRKLVVRDSYPQLLLFRHSLSVVRVIGLHVIVPSREPAGEPSPMMPLTYSNSATSLPIGVVFADGALLEFQTRAPEKRPFRMSISRLALHDVGANTPITFDVTLNNSDLPGEIRSMGAWGPWNPKQPGITPVHGEYVYRNANLAAFPVVSGTLNSQGKFSGELSRIYARGTVRIADFQVKDTSHRRQVSAAYRAVVDGTDGNVFLNQASAQFDHTTLVFNGSVAGEKAEPGKAVSLDVSSDGARIEDLIDLFIASPRPPMTGGIRLHGHIDLPPGSAALLERVKIEGAFGVDASQFTDRQTEQELARLSVSAVKGDKEEDRENPQTVLSDVAGQVNASGGVAHLSHVSFNVPGAKALLSGTFSLMNYQTNLQGLLITKGNVADATTGIKSLFVKVLTPFFKKKHRAKVVPFKITGPYGQTSIALNPGSKPR